MWEKKMSFTKWITKEKKKELFPVLGVTDIRTARGKVRFSDMNLIQTQSVKSKNSNW
jgi:hypothetical protein